MNALAIYQGSNGDETKALYGRLEALGPAGVIGLNLFRAQKCSARAKVYRRAHRSEAYDRKNWSLGNLDRALAQHGEALGLRWGWGKDEAQEFHKWVLYVDLPTGQVSFHAEAPLSAQRYPAEWDRSPLSAERIIRFVDSLLAR